jgi:hypothetical protein
LLVGADGIDRFLCAGHLVPPGRWVTSMRRMIKVIEMTLSPTGSPSLTARRSI